MQRFKVVVNTSVPSDVVIPGLKSESYESEVYDIHTVVQAAQSKFDIQNNSTARLQLLTFFLVINPEVNEFSWVPAAMCRPIQGYCD